MSKIETEEPIDNLLDTYIKVDKDDRAGFLEEINKEIEVFLSRKNDDKDATD